MTVHCLFTHAVKFAFVSVFFLATHAYGFTAYYISAAGSDANDGKTTSTPWKSITKLNATSLVSGDVVSFRSGDTFYGQITVNKSNIAIGSYGSGAKPVITGAIALTNWTVYSGSIYKAQSSAAVVNLFSNGVQMTIARYPNSGVLRVGSTNGSSTIASSGITQASGYWNGANMRIRIISWQYETIRVTSNTGSTLNLPAADYSYRTGAGFYLDNVLAALDAPGEWYYNPSDGSVYLYAPNGVNPNTLTVMGSVLNYGVTGSQSSVTVQNLAFHYQAQAAIYFNGTLSNVRVLSNDIYGQWLNAILFEYGGRYTSCVVDGNSLQMINGRGIDAFSFYSSSITNNTIRNIGTVIGYGISGVSGETGINVHGGGTTNNTISQNIIDSTGYIGIRCDAAASLVESNVITNTMLRLSDGGAIYLWNADQNSSIGTTVRNNIIENVPGDSTAIPTAYAWGTSAYGIYFDDATQDGIMTGNTIIHTGDAGVMLNVNTNSSIVLNNTLYECAVNGFMNSFRIYQDALSHPASQTKHNIIFPPSSGVGLYMMTQPNPITALLSMGTFDSNYYFNPYNNSNFAYCEGSNGYQTKSFATWKSSMGQDAHSTLAAGAGKVLFTNRTSSPTVVTLTPTAYKDVDGISVRGTMTLPPYSSRLLFVDNSVPLPVELVSFTAVKVNGSTVLNWKTATEVANYGFEIEKKAIGRSADTLWTKIGFVPGSGTTNTSHSYSFTDPAAPTVTYSYRLKQIDTDGQFVYSTAVTMTVTAVTDADVPVEFALEQNYPNPFNPSTTITYSIATAGPVRLTMYDVTGREVATLVNGRMDVGTYSVQWNAKELTSGVYFYRLTAGSFTSVKKLLLQK